MNQYDQYAAALGEQYGGLAELPSTGGFNLGLFALSVAAVLFGIGIGHLAKRSRR